MNDKVCAKTPGTLTVLCMCFKVVDLLVSMCRSALESPRKVVIFEPYPSVVDPNDPQMLAFNPRVSTCPCMPQPSPVAAAVILVLLTFFLLSYSFIRPIPDLLWTTYPSSRYGSFPKTQFTASFDLSHISLPHPFIY